MSSILARIGRLGQNIETEKAVDAPILLAAPIDDTWISNNKQISKEETEHPKLHLTKLLTRAMRVECLAWAPCPNFKGGHSHMCCRICEKSEYYLNDEYPTEIEELVEFFNLSVTIAQYYIVPKSRIIPYYAEIGCKPGLFITKSQWNVRNMDNMKLKLKSRYNGKDADFVFNTIKATADEYLRKALERDQIAQSYESIDISDDIGDIDSGAIGNISNKAVNIQDLKSFACSSTSPMTINPEMKTIRVNDYICYQHKIFPDRTVVAVVTGITGNLKNPIEVSTDDNLDSMDNVRKLLSDGAGSYIRNSGHTRLLSDYDLSTSPAPALGLVPVDAVISMDNKAFSKSPSSKLISADDILIDNEDYDDDEVDRTDIQNRKLKVKHNKHPMSTNRAMAVAAQTRASSRHKKKFSSPITPTHTVDMTAGECEGEGQAAHGVSDVTVVELHHEVMPCMRRDRDDTNITTVTCSALDLPSEQDNCKHDSDTDDPHTHVVEEVSAVLPCPCVLTADTAAAKRRRSAGAPDGLLMMLAGKPSPPLAQGSSSSSSLSLPSAKSDLAASAKLIRKKSPGDDQQWHDDDDVRLVSDESKRTSSARKRREQQQQQQQQQQNQNNHMKEQTKRISLDVAAAAAVVLRDSDEPPTHKGKASADDNSDFIDLSPWESTLITPSKRSSAHHNKKNKSR